MSPPQKYIILFPIPLKFIILHEQYRIHYTVHQYYVDHNSVSKKSAEDISSFLWYIATFLWLKKYKIGYKIGIGKSLPNQAIKELSQKKDVPYMKITTILNNNHLHYVYRRKSTCRKLYDIVGPE